MQIYNYNKITKVFTSISEATPNPEYPGEFLIRVNATIKEPPITSAFEVARFLGGAWKITIDKRGQHYYEQDGTKVEIVDFDVDIPVGCIQTDPPTIYHDSHDGTEWIENTALKAQDEVLQEVHDLKSNLKSAIVWQFRMIQAIWGTGVSKGIWAASDIESTELKQKYVEWGQKLTRLEELGE